MRTSVARREASWQRLIAGVLLALTVHGAAALALPTSYALPAQTIDSVPAREETVWVELGDEADGEAVSAMQTSASPAEARPLPRARPSAVRPAATTSTAERESAAQPVLSSSLAEPGDVGAAQGGAAGALQGFSGGTDGSERGAPGAAKGARGEARLLGAGDPCAGYFPVDSPASRGDVRLLVAVDARGLVSGNQVLDAHPPGAGFAQAAQACASRLRFAPATAADGAPVPSHVTLLLRFARPE